ncbi:MAG: PAS domain S-box protein [Phycisphaerales bacterium]|nr:MAG: PAS domain S-box protein [Phycisphaerales bacterium]
MAAEGFLVLDQQGHVVSYNAGCQHLIGYSLEDTNDGKRQYVATSLFPDYWEIAKAGPGHRRRLRMIHKDGHPIILDAVYTPIRNAQNEVAFLACTIAATSPSESLTNDPGNGSDAGDHYVTAKTDAKTLDQILQEVERRAILAALRSTGGRRTDAAAQMGISRSRLYRRLEALGI